MCFLSKALCVRGGHCDNPSVPSYLSAVGMVSESCCPCPWSSCSPSPGAAGQWMCSLALFAAVTRCLPSLRWLRGEMHLLEHINHIHISTVGTKHKTETQKYWFPLPYPSFLLLLSCVCTAGYSSSFHCSAACEILSLCPWKTQSQGDHNLQMPPGMIMCLCPQHLGFRLDTI